MKDNPWGRIKGVYLKNIIWDNPDNPFILKGAGPDNLVENITFDHCYVNGKLLKSFADANFIVNQYVSNVKFVDNP